MKQWYREIVRNAVVAYILVVNCTKQGCDNGYSYSDRTKLKCMWLVRYHGWWLTKRGETCPECRRKALKQ